ncbi:MAG: hypothetical protein AABY86_12745 [Bdellovibrionota bacterium]
MAFSTQNLIGHLEIILLCMMLMSCGRDSSQKDQSSSSQSIPQIGGQSNRGMSVQGYNQVGVETSCVIPSEELMCTMMYTEGEQFAAKCNAEGGQAVTCACHQYLCSKKIVFP